MTNENKKMLLNIGLAAVFIAFLKAKTKKVVTKETTTVYPLASDSPLLPPAPQFLPDVVLPADTNNVDCGCSGTKDVNPLITGSGTNITIVTNPGFGSPITTDDKPDDIDRIINAINNHPHNVNINGISTDGGGVQEVPFPITVEYFNQ